MAKATLLFDLDGTLCECGKYYGDAVERFVRWKSGATQLPPDLLRNILNNIDLQQASIIRGFSRHRFPRSFEAASLVADVITGMVPDVAASKYAHQLGEDVYFADYALLPGTEDALSKCVEQGWQLVLVTKGAPDIQMRKIYKNRLERFFPEHFIQVVAEKSPEGMARIVKAYDVDVVNSFVIGDSLKDDIYPGHANGLATFHITAETTWAYDDHDCTPDYALVGSIADLPTKLAAVVPLSV